MEERKRKFKKINKFKSNKKMNIKCESKILRKIIFIFFLISNYIIIIKNNDFFNLEKNISPKFTIEEIREFEERVTSNLSMNTYEEFYSINSQDKLIEENVKFEKSKNPEVSIVIAAYNFDKCIHRVLRSIQNQSLKNLEIIIIDDCSTDNTVEVIKKYQKEDPRIILIEHDSNDSPMKSRSDGIRKASGKYITIMDGDDAFLHKDILKNSLYIANKGNIDVIEFNHAMYNEGHFEQVAQFFYKLNLTNIIYQPELRNIFIDINNNFPDDFKNRAIWSKLVRKEVFLKMLEYIGTEFSDDYIIWGEDTLMVVALVRTANSYYFIKEYGYYRNVGPNRRISSKIKNKVCKSNGKIRDFSFFKFLKFLVAKAGKNEKDQIMAYKEVTTGVKYNNYLNDFKMSKKHFEILFYIFDNALEFNFLNEQQKDYLRRLRSRAIEKRNREKIE